MSKEVVAQDQGRLYLSVISEFAVDLLKMNSVEQIVWHTAKNVVARLGFEDIVIYLFDPHTKRLVPKATYGEKNPSEHTKFEPMEIELGTGIVGRAAITKRPIVIDDTRQYYDYIVDDKPRLSELAVPMVVDGKLIGVIDSEHPDVAFYSQEQLDIVITIASMVATQISKLQSVVELQRTVDKLEYSSKIQDSLFEIAELIFETESLEEFYKRLHQCIARLTFAKNFYIARQSKDKKSITLPYCVDELDDVGANETIILSDTKPSITGYVLMANKAYLVYENELRQMVDEGKVYILGSLPKAWLGVPFGDDKNRGIVVVQSYSDGYMFTEKDRQLLKFVAKHIHNAMERMQSKADLEFLALHDPLTKLPNRLLFADRVKHAIASIKRKGETSLSVLFLDLDKFKQVNDSYGHHIGDHLLIEIANRISECLRSSDTLCRLGGDEFAILLEDIESGNDTATVADKIIERVQEIVSIDDLNISISTSIGVADYRSQDISVNTLLVRADEAMYQAKILGRNQVYYYSEKNNKENTDSYKIERDFLAALGKKELYLVFQPIVKLKTGVIVGAEALIRWRHPKLNIVPPDNFLPAIEKAGLLHHLDLYVAEAAMTFIEKHQDIFHDKFKLSINISGASFTAPELMEKLKYYYDHTPQLLSNLCIEITEQTIVDHIKNTQKNIRLMNSMGIHISLDDFGTGYSSLSYIHQFTFNTIKIDRAFIKNVEDGKNTGVILETIVNLSSSLNIKTVAEGIETKEQFKLLGDLNCDRGQGYFMSKPLEENPFIDLVNSKTCYKQLENPE